MLFDSKEGKKTADFSRSAAGSPGGTLGATDFREDRKNAFLVFTHSIVSREVYEKHG
jgi:hypothetical protein